MALKSTTMYPIKKFAELTSFLVVDLMGNNTDKNSD